MMKFVLLLFLLDAFGSGKTDSSLLEIKLPKVILLKNISNDIEGRKRHRNDSNTTNEFPHRHNVAFGRRLKHRSVTEMESELRRHVVSVLAIIEAKIERFDLNLLKLLQSRSQNFHYHIESRSGKHSETSTGIDDGTAAFIAVPNTRRDVEHLAVGGDTDEIDAVEAAVRVANVEFGVGHFGGRFSRGSGGGSGRGRNAEDEITDSSLIGEMIDKAVREAAAVGVFCGFVS